MLALLRREPALRLTPVAAALALVVMSLLAPAILAYGEVALDRDPVTGDWRSRGGIYPSLAYPLLLVSALQSVLITAARFVPVRHRVRELERTLPITARSIVFARLAGVWILFAAPLLVASLALVGRPFAEGSYVGVVLRALAALTLGVVALFAYRPAAITLRWYESLGLALVAFAVVVAAPLVDVPALELTYAVLAGVGVLFIAWRVPLAVPPDDPRIAAAREVPGSAPSGRTPRRGLADWTILRSTILRPPLVAVSGLGLALAASGASGNPMILVWFPALLAGVVLRFGLNALHGLDSLPIPRARILALAGLPVLVIVAGVLLLATREPKPYLSFGMLSHGVLLDTGSDEALGLPEEEYRQHVRVPPHLWRIAASAEDAEIVAPWGESTVPMRHPVFFGSRTFAYCPYDVQPENSVRFLMWQIARALRDVHDFEGSWREVHATWFPGLSLDAPIADSYLPQQGSDHWGFAVDDGPKVPNSAWFALLIATLMWFVVQFAILRPNVPDARGRRWRQFAQSDAALMSLLVVVVVGLQFIEANDRALLDVLGTRAHARLDAALGSSPFAWAALVLAIAGLAYAVLRWRIGRVEVPPLLVSGWSKKSVAIY